MPFEIPTLPALITRAAEDLQREGVDGVLRRSDAAVLARVQAGGVFGLYGYLGWLSKQILPDTCDEEMLQRWANLKKVIRTPATRASCEIEVLGSNGVVIPVGFIWQTQAGVRYLVEQGATISAGTAIVSVAAEETGQDSNVVVGQKLQAVSPLAGLTDVALVDGNILNGVDEEPLERWRRRVIRSFRVQPHGGDKDDYVTWALEVPGITRAWAKRRWVGPGTVGVFVVRDDDDPITPNPTELLAVQDHIESVMPVTADVTVLAPSILPVDFEISVTPDDEVVKLRIENSLRDLFLAESDLGARLFRSHITQAISNTPGEIDHSLVLPAADILPAANELPTLGNITWL